MNTAFDTPLRVAIAPDAVLAEAGDDAGLRPDLPARSGNAQEDDQLQVWVEAMVAQDEKALSKLYDATLSRVYGLILRILHNRALADEVIAETYFQAWRQAVRFDARKGKAITWLLNIARSRAIDALRKEERFVHENIESHPTFDSHAALGSSADELIELTRNNRLLNDALHTLGAQPRQLVALAFFKGFSHEEISVHMALPLGTVKSQLRRALTSLRAVIGDSAPSAVES
jgi:RNA polymerase sigma factor (sigma-70 family)